MSMTISEALIAEYTKLDFLKIKELPIDVYCLYMRDAFIYKQNQTESGREYLKKCWLLEQTTPDRKGLRENFGKKE